MHTKRRYDGTLEVYNPTSSTRIIDRDIEVFGDIPAGAAIGAMGGGARIIVRGNVSSGALLAVRGGAATIDIHGSVI